MRWASSIHAGKGSQRNEFAPAFLLGVSTTGIAIVVLVGLVLRGLFVLALPRTAIGFDLTAWVEVARLLADNQNPYNLTPFLNWPPAWMQIVFALDHVGRWVHLPLVDSIRVLLVGADSVALLLLAVMLRRLARAVCGCSYSAGQSIQYPFWSAVNRGTLMCSLRSRSSRSCTSC